MSNKKPILVATDETKKSFNYTLDGISIGFNFRIDVKKELKAGKEILQRAMKDIDVELAKIDEKNNEPKNK